MAITLAATRAAVMERRVRALADGRGPPGRGADDDANGGDAGMSTHWWHVALSWARRWRCSPGWPRRRWRGTGGARRPGPAGAARMTRKRRRLYVLLLCAIGLGSATALTLTAFQDNLVFFRSPSDIAREAPPAGRAFRLGGLVEEAAWTARASMGGGRHPLPRHRRRAPGGRCCSPASCRTCSARARAW
jgi:hypothetical protein